jgi:hypothetical protein
MTPRPVVPVVVERLEAVPQLCLVDSGTLHNRFARWIADAAGISVDPPSERIAVGGVVTTANVARVELTLGDIRFEAPVWFCDPWPFAFNLLAQEGFLRYFRVTLCAAEDWFDCEPESGGA